STPMQSTGSLTSGRQPTSLRFQRNISIRGALVAAFLVPITLAVGAVGWLTIRSGQQAVLELTDVLHEKAIARVEQELGNYLEAPHLINQINAGDLAIGELDLDDSASLEKRFWRQIQLFPSVSYIYAGTAAGLFSGAEPSEAGLPKVAYWVDDDPEGNVETYATDAKGSRTELLSTDSGYDMFQRPWYTTAQEAGQPTWGEAYVWAFPTPEIALPALQPILDQNGDFRGVFAVDLSLTAIGEFLKTFEISETAQVFIVERSGLMVASSTGDPLFTEQADGPVRLSASQSESPLVRGAMSHLEATFGDLSQIGQVQELEFGLDGENQLLRVQPYQDEFGLDWLIIAVIPEADFMAQINENITKTVLLGFAALLIAATLGILAARRLTTPLIAMSQASEAIARGELDQRVEVTGVEEISKLARSFNQMAQQMQQSFVDLEDANSRLEERIAERTEALNEQAALLQEDIERLLDVADAVDEGDLTVSAAVSPTSTGLVADTFNRLIERFGQMMTMVSGASEQVNQRADQVEGLAGDTADNARQQVESVIQMQALMENINTLSQGNAQHVAASDGAVGDAQTAVEQGQQEIAAVNGDIDVLHQEMHQIVGRTQTLTSYTDLAAQFVKDQKRIATLTRVLAMNASMLSTRAAKQQDPNQFTAITREFEAIADQVNDLATQTNQSLMVLQQRTEQIQTVVSGLNSDVEVISQRTDSLTSGVNQSNRAFEQIRAATKQVAALGQEVNQSSRDIAEAAQAALQPIQEISSIAMQTFDRANATTEQSQVMERVARTLQQSVSQFHLPPEAASGVESAAAPVPPR
ncbi:MAG: methyl-accepting chemotaxis protein, partial [Cyanobacteria bacterium P01_A01_bin.135]